MLWRHVLIMPEVKLLNLKSYISDHDIFINMSKTCTLNFLVYCSEKVFNMEYRIRLAHYSNEFRRQRSVEIQISHYSAFP